MSEICLLCKKIKVYQIKSHLTPAGITKNTYGERNKEVIYTINLENKTVCRFPENRKKTPRVAISLPFGNFVVSQIDKKVLKEGRQFDLEIKISSQC